MFLFGIRLNRLVGYKSGSVSEQNQTGLSLAKQTNKPTNKNSEGQGEGYCSMTEWKVLENSRAVFCWVLKKVLVAWKRRYSLTLAVHYNYMGNCDFYEFFKNWKRKWNSSLLTENYTHHMCTAWWIFTSKYTCVVITHMKEILPASRIRCSSPPQELPCST